MTVLLALKKHKRKRGVQMYSSASEFYRSKDWQDFRRVIMEQRTNEQGQIICAECGKPIVKQYDCIAHHIKEITLTNLNDCNITLNPDNIELLHARCHNLRHARFGFCSLKRVYIVFGSPLSGKTSYVNEVMGQNDIKVDMDDIYYCISNNPKYFKPNSLFDVARATYDCLLDQIKTRSGRWQSAYIIGGYPYKVQRERLAQELGAELIYIDCTQEEALARLECCTDGRDKKEWKHYIEVWFERFTK